MVRNTAVACLLLFSRELFAQVSTSAHWHSRLQANGNLFFGSTRQELVATEGVLSRRDSVLETEMTVRFRYGESTDAAGITRVVSRGLLGVLTFDAQPRARISPFILGSGETSFEKRLARRYAAGAGAKWVLTRTPRGTSSLSLALLGEWTHIVTPPPTALATPLRQAVVRWSGRVKTDRRMGDRVSLAHTTFYKPVVTDFGRYVITSITQARYSVASAVSLTATFVDNYDSEAGRRGARVNNDGQLLLGVQLAR